MRVLRLNSLYLRTGYALFRLVPTGYALIVTAGLMKVAGTLERLREDDAAHDLGVCNRVLELNGNDANDGRLERRIREAGCIRSPHERGYRLGARRLLLRAGHVRHGVTLLCANTAAIHLITLAVENMGLGEFNAERLDLTLHWNMLRPDLEAASAAEGRA
jgi:hypothetical protein